MSSIASLRKEVEGLAELTANVEELAGLLGVTPTETKKATKKAAAKKDKAGAEDDAALDPLKIGDIICLEKVKNDDDDPVRGMLLADRAEGRCGVQEQGSERTAFNYSDYAFRILPNLRYAGGAGGGGLFLPCS